MGQKLIKKFAKSFISKAITFDFEAHYYNYQIQPYADIIFLVTFFFFKRTYVDIFKICQNYKIYYYVDQKIVFYF